MIIRTFRQKFTSLIILIIIAFILSKSIAASLAVKDSIAAIEKLPKPTQLLNLSKDYSEPSLIGINFNLEDPLNFEFIVDSGDEKSINRADANRLISYFFTALTVDEDKLWVNLSPYESNRIIDDSLAQTELGRDFLTQDYMLKQIASSLTHPNTSLGREYWDNIDEKQNIADTIQKVWIAPDLASVNEYNGTVYISDASLKVLSEDDYLAMSLNNISNDSRLAKSPTNKILASLKDDINNGERFARLRQIYNAVILAKWFRYKFQNSIYDENFDSNKVQFLETAMNNSKEFVYAKYKEAYAKGIYKIQEKHSPSQRKLYFSGGLKLAIENLPVSELKYKPDFDGNKIIIESSAIFNVLNEEHELLNYIDGIELNPFMVDLLKGKYPEDIDNIDELVELLKNNSFFEGDFLEYFPALKEIKFSIAEEGETEESFRVSLKSADQTGGEAHIYEFAAGTRIMVLRKLLKDDFKSVLNNARSYLIAKILSQENATPKPLAFAAAESYVSYVQRSNEKYTFFSVSEYGGPDLRYLISQKYNYDMKTALERLLYVFEGVALMHSYNIRHADIKPHNILIDLNKKGSLIDFSLAQVGGYPLLKSDGTFDGTLEYLAPEIVEMLYLKKGRGMFNNYSKANDIYALGCVLFEMLTGKSYWNVKFDYRKPKKIQAFYENFDYSEFMQKRFKESSLTPIARYLLKKMLAHDPSKRLTIEELINESELLLNLYDNLTGNENYDQLLTKMVTAIPNLIAEHEQKIELYKEERQKVRRFGKTTISLFAKVKYLFGGRVALNANKAMRKKFSQIRYRINREENRIKILKNELAEFQSTLSVDNANKEIDGGVDFNNLELDLSDVKIVDNKNQSKAMFLGLSFKINSISKE